MQLKTIRKNLQSKMTEWMDSMDDKVLSEKVKDNILVSGGSITSMLRNEPINDYDVYINDPGVLLDLVSYYTKLYPKIKILTWKDRDALLKKIDSFSDDDFKLKVALRTLKEGQVKLFIESKEGGYKVECKKPEELVYRPVFFSPNAISLSNDVQIVLRFHGDDKAIHKTFDFVHATNYFTFEDGLITNKEALESIITKRLKYQGSLYPLTSIIRMKKFVKRGWNIGAGEILKIMFQISELDLKNPDVLEDQLIGVDVAYFSTLINVLRGVKTEKVTSHFLNTLIDRVFDE